MPDFSDFKCDWLDKESIWAEAEDARNKYWPENTFPIESEIVIQGGLSLDDYIDFMNTAPDREIWNYEFQASEFSGRFLVPITELSREIEIRCDEAIKNGHIDKYVQNPDLLLTLISPDIADIFGVTFKNIEERVKREAIWPPDCLKI